MMETQHSKRWEQASAELGLRDDRDERSLEKAYGREQKRKERIESSLSYNIIRGIANVMDRYCLDPIIGLIPGVGDALSSIVSLPFLYVSMFKVRSFRLTLAVTANILLDLLVGLIPYGIGNISDFFYRANLKNFRLITGFVEGDQEVISKVNSRAVWMFFAIILLLGLIALVVWLLIKLGADLVAGVHWLVGVVAGWFGK